MRGWLLLPFCQSYTDTSLTFNVFGAPGTAVFCDLLHRNGVSFNGDVGRTRVTFDADLAGNIGKVARVFANAGYETGTQSPATPSPAGSD